MICKIPSWGAVSVLHFAVGKYQPLLATVLESKIMGSSTWFLLSCLPGRFAFQGYGVVTGLRRSGLLSKFGTIKVFPK